MSAFTLWLPVTIRVQLGHREDYKILRADGKCAAYVGGKAIGIMGQSNIHRMGRRDA